MALKETLSYSDGVKGWPSFYSYLPDFMVGMNSFFYTFHEGNLFRHNTSVTRNQYYEVNYNSSITSVFNVEPQTIKLFKTMSFESDDAWAVTSLSTELSTGSMLSTNFVEKEAEWFSFIRSNASTVNFKLRSTNGIGTLSDLTAVAPLGSFQLKFLVNISSILSIGDTIYYQPAATPTTFRKVGVVSNINRDTSTGIVSLIENNQGGIGYPASGSGVTTTVTSGAGDGTLTVIYTQTAGVIDFNTVEVVYGGEGYAVGDTFNIDGVIPANTTGATVSSVVANVITLDTVINSPSIGDFVFFYKDPVAESHGARGYYMRFTLENSNPNAVELFSVGSSIMKSYP